MSCPHIEQVRLRAPRPSESVHREDCTQCFDGIDDPTGLNVCMSCFNGGCTSERQHAAHHHKLTQHPIYLNIQRIRKPKPERDEPPKKISKLAIAAESESDKYDIKTSVGCYACGDKEIDKEQGNLPEVIKGVMSALTFSRQVEVKAWEQEITPCEHTLRLEQDVPKQLESQALAHCASCDLKENLWLCLQCGNLGCGRAQFGGVGGNGHALGHFEFSKHPVSVKLGSITPDGTADVYCYSCNDERTDPELAKHLAYWGINIAERAKTEKSLTEMQIEQNLKWEFSMTTGDGKELKPIFGKGLTGLKNLGNSCYLASILQCLFNLPVFKSRYYDEVEGQPVDRANPAEDLETQLRKVADGLLSGRYSIPDTDIQASAYSPEIPHQKGLSPSMLKGLIGKGHAEFSTMRQQDAFELLLHLFKLITRIQHKEPLNDPVSAFKFAMEERIQCLSCGRVRYKTYAQDNISIPVPARKAKQVGANMEVHAAGGKEFGAKDIYEPVTFKECLDIFTASEEIEYKCKACGKKDGAMKQSKFLTFPEVLVVNCRRFAIINWVPTKIDVPVVMQDDPIILDGYMTQASHGEQELSEDEEEDKAKPSFTPNEAILNQLLQMGFPQTRCVKALYNTGNTDLDEAMNWLFSHMEDPGIDQPLALDGGASDADMQVSEENVEMLGAMGFTPTQARKALSETANNMERAVEWLFSHPDESGEDAAVTDTSLKVTETPKKQPGRIDLPARFRLNSIVCHKGGSIHAGHYVAFVRKALEGEDSDSWVLFNDEKVVKAVDADETKKFAYMYFFQRT